MKIVTAGHVCVDLTPSLIGHSPGLEPGILYAVGALNQRLGGSVANTGGTLSRLGAAVETHATIGDDELGDLCQRLLGRAITGGTHLATSVELGTSYSIVVEHGAHDRTFWQYEGANAEFDPRRVELEPEVELFHVGYPSLLPGLCRDAGLLSEAFAAARSRGVTTSLDQAHVADGSVASLTDWSAWFARTIPHTDVWSPSWDDMSSALRLTERPSREAMTALALQMLDWGAAVVQLSAGSLGFVLATAGAERLARGGHVVAALADTWAGQLHWFPAERIENPKTTVGAGDALTAGLLRALHLGYEPIQAGGFARAVVGRHLRGQGLSDIDASSR